jgi:hypothetical protein
MAQAPLSFGLRPQETASDARRVGAQPPRSSGYDPEATTHPPTPSLAPNPIPQPQPPAPQILVFNLPVNFAQGTSIFWAYVVGFRESPLTAIQV